MKKIKALSIALVISLVISPLILYFIDKRYSNLSVKNNSIKYLTTYSKYNSHDVLVSNIDKNTILLMGSSELVAGIDFEEHPKSLLDFADKNIMQIGGGHYQSLLHSIILGSISKDIPVNTVNLILSMQWFTKEGILSDAFLSRFSVDHINNLYRNDKLSDKLKNKILNRVLELSKENDFNKSYIKTLLSNDLSDKILKNFYYWKYKFLNKKEFFKDYDRDNSINEKVFKDIDWEKLEKQAIQRAKDETQNNTFYIKNDYFDEYIKNIEDYKGKSKDTTFSESPEYGDLQLFLDVANELKFKVNLIMVPLQGYWADYTGVPKIEIDKFYNNIRNMAKENNVNLIDYSEFSYEPYFFKDIMHLGRLGLLKLQKDLLKCN